MRNSCRAERMALISFDHVRCQRGSRSLEGSFGGEGPGNPATVVAGKTKDANR